MWQATSTHINVRKLIESDEIGVSLWLPTFTRWQARRLPHLPIPRRDPMSPPDLPADAPVPDVLQPLRVHSFPMGRKETDQMIAHDSERLFCLRITQEPLFADSRFNRDFASIAKPNVVFVRLTF